LGYFARRHSVSDEFGYLKQQMENVPCIAPVGLLRPHAEPANPRRISGPELMAQFSQQPLESLRIAHLFHPYAHRPGKGFGKTGASPFSCPNRPSHSSPVSVSTMAICW
jgi:hypothetical protein